MQVGCQAERLRTFGEVYLVQPFTGIAEGRL
jgi:hypothetical protein